MLWSTILYYECNIADGVPAYSVELSISIPISGEAVPLRGKCCRNCHGIAATEESNVRTVEREGEAGLCLRYDSNMFSQVVFVSRENEILVMSSLLLTLIFSAIVSCLEGNQRAVTLKVK